MHPADPPIRNISDTARWVAWYRARETDRPDAIFRDPLARRLAGERGEQIARNMPFADEHSWTWVARTYLFDQYVLEQINDGADTVLNLAAGLDTRPYRMALPSTLRWIEVDLPDLLDEKERLLAGEKPVCQLETVRLDLADRPARCELFERVGRTAKKVLVVSEGLIIYLTAEQVAALATDLAVPPTFQGWAFDLVSPRLLTMMKERTDRHLNQAGAPFHFGPEQGPSFFAPYGWRPKAVRSLLKTARKLKRLSLSMWLISLLPEAPPPPGNRPWSAICLMEKCPPAKGHGLT